MRGKNAHLLCALGGGIPEVVDMACRVLKKNTYFRIQATLTEAVSYLQTQFEYPRPDSTSFPRKVVCLNRSMASSSCPWFCARVACPTQPGSELGSAFCDSLKLVLASSSFPLRRYNIPKFAQALALFSIVTDRTKAC